MESSGTEKRWSMKIDAAVSVKPASIPEMPGAARGATRTLFQGDRADGDLLKSTSFSIEAKRRFYRSAHAAGATVAAHDKAAPNRERE